MIKVINPKKIILSHAGKQHSYHVAKAMNDLGVLEGFYTSSYIRSEYLQKLILQSANTLLDRRFLKGLSGNKVHSNWRFEWKELLYSRIYGAGERTQKAVYERDEEFDRFMARKLGRIQGDVFWGFQGSAHESLKSARKNNKLAILELATAHVSEAKAILGEEKELHPEWADSFDNLEFPEYYETRLEEEPHIADIVIAASSFTKSTLMKSGVEKKKIRVLPLGVDLNNISYTHIKERKRGPLKLLYAGRITQRKGIKYLLEAMKQFDSNEVELHIIGYMHGTGNGLKQYEGLYNLHPALSQQQLFNEYNNYDALVLPSLFEGFGLVIIEAMAAGLPVIASDHTFGPDIIEHGKDGYIVPVRSIEAIVDAVRYLLEMDSGQRDLMHENARNKAIKYTWNEYSLRLMEILSTLKVL